MIKELIINEINNAVSLKNNIDSELAKGGLIESAVKDLQQVVLEQENKISELRKLYDFIDMAEQYQNLEVLGMNYASRDPSLFRNQEIKKIEAERQALARDLHVAISGVLKTLSDKSKQAYNLIDTDPSKAKDEILYVTKYIEGLISRVNQEVVNIQSDRTENGFTADIESVSSSLSDIRTPEYELIQSLTRREKDVLKSIAKGMSNKEIGVLLNISERTVKNHVSNVFKKIKVMDRTQAALFAIRNNFIKVF